MDHAEHSPGDSIGQAVEHLARSFRAAGLDSAGLDARVLVCEGAGVSRSTLLAAPDLPLDPGASRRIAEFRLRRLAREPVSRILGRREFHGLTLKLGAATLDPRPETETVVEAALDLARQGLVPGGRTPRILDLGTGTGAILIALLLELPDATGVGTDIATAALDVARCNARHHGVAARAEFRCADWLAGLSDTFDLIVSNPPYVARSEFALLDQEVARYDPYLALDGGEDGLTAYRAILRGVSRVLNPAGWLLLEVSPATADAVVELCREQGLAPGGDRAWVRTDLAGRPRCVAGRARQ